MKVELVGGPFDGKQTNIPYPVEYIRLVEPVPLSFMEIRAEMEPQARVPIEEYRRSSFANVYMWVPKEKEPITIVQDGAELKEAIQRRDRWLIIAGFVVGCLVILLIIK